MVTNNDVNPFLNANKNANGYGKDFFYYDFLRFGKECY